MTGAEPMLTLTDFLLARIAEDEYAKHGCEGTGEYRHCHDMSERYERYAKAARQIAEMDSDDLRDPDYRHAIEAAVAHLAAVYRDHPDYREEWSA